MTRPFLVVAVGDHELDVGRALHRLLEQDHGRGEARQLGVLDARDQAGGGEHLGRAGHRVEQERVERILRFRDLAVAGFEDRERADEDRQDAAGNGHRASGRGAALLNCGPGF
jgi:hypothetical protein